jgi:hypothetical protein
VKPASQKLFVHLNTFLVATLHEFQRTSKKSGYIKIVSSSGMKRLKYGNRMKGNENTNIF